MVDSSEFLFIGSKLIPYSCSYCHIDITQYLRINCNDCLNINLCYNCYCSGVEIDQHKSYHSYRVIDCIQYPIFNKEWLISEELLLLEGIEKHGLGNWKNIADYVGTKTSRACENHYWNDYLGRFGYCLPVNTFLPDRQTQVPTQTVLFPNACPESSLVHLPSNDLIGLPTSCLPNLNSDDSNVLSSETGSKLRESLSTSTKKEQEIREKLATLPGAEIAGYMPLREDFDTEHNNDAEQLLVDMEFTADEHPSERLMKLKVIELYNQKLTERDERKKFVITRGLIDIKKQQQIEKKRTKEERDLASRLKIFARFLTQEEYESLIDGVIDMRKLKKQIECYRLYRSMGIRTIDQARKYETDRKRREYQLKAQKSRQSSNYLPNAASELTSSNNLNGIDNQYTNNVNGIHSNNSSSNTISTRRAQSLSLLGNSSSSSLANDVNQKKSINLVNIPDSFRSTPGAELLSELELELCFHIQMYPFHYITVLEGIVREIFRNGTLTLDGFHRIIRTNESTTRSNSSSNDNQIISSENSKVLFDFFVEHILKGNLTQKQFQSAEYVKRQNSQSGLENNGHNDSTTITTTVSTPSEKKRSNSTTESERSYRKRKIAEDD